MLFMLPRKAGIQKLLKSLETIEGSIKGFNGQEMVQSSTQVE